MSTFERAYELARSGKYPNVAALKLRLETEGCRAVDAFLAVRATRDHLNAICAATHRAAAPAAAQTAPPPTDDAP